MELSDALLITALGMGVVFSGLLLTALLITAFGLLGRHAEHSGSEETAAAATAAGTLSPAPEDPRVIAVIATVLEVERRLHRAEMGGRLTISRSN